MAKQMKQNNRGFARRFVLRLSKCTIMVQVRHVQRTVNVFSFTVSAQALATARITPCSNSGAPPQARLRHDYQSVSHEFNLLTSLAGRFDTIACNVKGTISNVPQFDTNSTMVMRCKNGAVASIMTSWSSGAGANLKGYIGTNGSILLRGRNMFEFDSLTYKTVDMDHEESITFTIPMISNKDEVIYHVHVFTPRTA